MERPIPAFYGAWYFELPKDHPDEPDEQRPVYLILIQYVEGQSVREYLKESEDDETEELDPNKLPPEPFRLKVLENVLTTGIWLPPHADIRHRDITPRNVITMSNGSIVLVDFSIIDI